MGINLENFNRIIDLTFIGSATRYNGSELALQNYQKSIYCPRYGQKPNIEINGTFGSSLTLNALHIKIQNLYLDFRTEQYSKINVRAGYANNYTTFEADIFNMFQEDPGPEGTTIILCNRGSVTQTWLSSTVSLNFEKESGLLDILQKIKTSLGLTEVSIGTKARALTLKQPLQFDGTVRGALVELEKRFQEKNLKIIMQGSVLCAICMTEGDFINSRVLQYMSAPPQQNPGDSDGNWQSMITAPWMPDLLPGDQLIIPQNVYINSGNLVGGGVAKTQKMQVQELSFHFGTRGSVNQMTCEGFIVR